MLGWLHNSTFWLCVVDCDTAVSLYRIAVPSDALAYLLTSISSCSGSTVLDCRDSQFRTSLSPTTTPFNSIGCFTAAEKEPLCQIMHERNATCTCSGRKCTNLPLLSGLGCTKKYRCPTRRSILSNPRRQDCFAQTLKDNTAVDTAVFVETHVLHRADHTSFACR